MTFNVNEYVRRLDISSFPSNSQATILGFLYMIIK